jgi:WD40 repeat protein
MQNYRYVNFKHYLDKNNKRDLVLSIFCVSDNIKLWDVKNWECILNLKNINNSPYLGCACFLNDNNVDYIITSCRNNKNESRPIKVFDFNGNKIKEIKDSCDRTVFVDTYYDKTLCKNFIITGNKGFIKSYDYDENKIYHKYCDNDNKHHDSVVINNKEDIIKLIDSCKDGVIRIWNFHSGLLINKIKVRKDYNLYGLCLWNNEYLFVGCEDKTIKLIELKSGKNIRNLIGHNNRVITIKKIILPKYGECLISQGYNNDQIKLWINKS